MTVKVLNASGEVDDSVRYLLGVFVMPVYVQLLAEHFAAEGTEFWVGWEYGALMFTVVRPPEALLIRRLTWEYLISLHDEPLEDLLSTEGPLFQFVPDFKLTMYLPNYDSEKLGEGWSPEKKFKLIQGLIAALLAAEIPFRRYIHLEQMDEPEASFCAHIGLTSVGNDVDHRLGSFAEVALEFILGTKLPDEAIRPCLDPLVDMGAMRMESPAGADVEALRCLVKEMRKTGFKILTPGSSRRLDLSEALLSVAREAVSGKDGALFTIKPRVRNTDGSLEYSLRVSLPTLDSENTNEKE